MWCIGVKWPISIGNYCFRVSKTKLGDIRRKNLFQKLDSGKKISALKNGA